MISDIHTYTFLRPNKYAYSEFRPSERNFSMNSRSLFDPERSEWASLLKAEGRKTAKLAYPLPAYFKT